MFESQSTLSWRVVKLALNPDITSARVKSPTKSKNGVGTKFEPNTKGMPLVFFSVMAYGLSSVKQDFYYFVVKLS